MSEIQFNDPDVTNYYQSRQVEAKFKNHYMPYKAVIHVMDGLINSAKEGLPKKDVGNIIKSVNLIVPINNGLSYINELKYRKLMSIDPKAQGRWESIVQSLPLEQQLYVVQSTRKDVEKSNPDSTKLIEMLDARLSMTRDLFAESALDIVHTVTDLNVCKSSIDKFDIAQELGFRVNRYQDPHQKMDMMSLLCGVSTLNKKNQGDFRSKVQSMPPEVGQHYVEQFLEYEITYGINNTEFVEDMGDIDKKLKNKIRVSRSAIVANVM